MMDSEQCIRNALGYAYSALRLRDRFFSPTDTKSAYEDYCTRLSNLLNAAGCMDIRNAEVEAFYTNKVSEEEFASMIITKVLSKRRSGSALTPLFALTWEFYSPIVTTAENVADIHEVSLRHLWEIFIRLDTEGDTTLSVDDVVALVLTIFHANGVHRSGAEIGEWFYPHTLVNYISFISALSNGHAKCLKPVIVYHLHEVITTEVVKKGRLTKKGHRVPSWKERFFVLKPSSIDYFMEGEDDGRKEQKGSIVLTPTSQVTFLPGTKNFLYVFRVESSNDVTDIAAPDTKVMMEWVEAIKLAIKMNELISTGLNILQCYHQAQRELSPSYNEVVPPEITKPTPTPASNHTPLHHLKSAPLAQPVPLQSPSPNPSPNPTVSSSAPVPAKRKPRPHSTAYTSQEQPSGSPSHPPLPLPYSNTPPKAPVKSPSPPPPSVAIETDNTGSGDGVVARRIPQHIFVGLGGRDDYALVDKVPEATSSPSPFTATTVTRPINPEPAPRVPRPRKNNPSVAGSREERSGEEEEEGRRLMATVSDSALVVPPPRGASAVPRAPKPYNGTSPQTSVPPSDPSAPAVPPRLGRAKVS